MMNLIPKPSMFITQQLKTARSVVFPRKVKSLDFTSASYRSTRAAYHDLCFPTLNKRNQS